MAKVLGRFNMSEAKLVGSTLPTNCKFNARQCSKSEMDKADIKKVPYASTVGNLMYSMVSTRQEIAFTVGTVR